MKNVWGGSSISLSKWNQKPTTLLSLLLSHLIIYIFPPAVILLPSLFSIGINLAYAFMSNLCVAQPQRSGTVACDWLQPSIVSVWRLTTWGLTVMIVPWIGIYRIPFFHFYFFPEPLGVEYKNALSSSLISFAFLFSYSNFIFVWGGHD